MQAKQHHDQDPQEYQYFLRTSQVSIRMFWSVIIAFAIVIAVFFLEIIVNNKKNQILEEKYYDSTTGSSNEPGLKKHCCIPGIMCLDHHLHIS